MDNMQKIAEYKLRQYGYNGVSISLPKVFQRDNNMEFGDLVEIHRTQIDGCDALIILPKKEKAQEKIAE